MVIRVVPVRDEGLPGIEEKESLLQLEKYTMSKAEHPRGMPKKIASIGIRIQPFFPRRRLPENEES